MKSLFFKLQRNLVVAALLLGCALEAAAQRGGAGFGGATGTGRGNVGGGRGNINTGPVTPRIVAVGDDRTNSLIVSAPEDVIEMIRELVMMVDVNVNDVTELRVFKMQNANPNDIVQQLATLFPDETRSNNNGNQFGGAAAFFAGGRGGRGAAATQSGRALRLTRVMSVADPRTSSVIVSASKTMMEEIALMIERLDTDSSRKPKAVVFDLKNADPLEVELVLQNMFQTTTTANRRTTGNNTTALGSRQQGTNRGLGATRTTTGGGGGGFGGVTGGQGGN